MTSAFPNAHNRPVVRYIGNDDRIGSYAHVVADGDAPEDLCACTNSYSVAEVRLTGALAAMTQRDAVKQHEIAPGDNFVTHDDSCAVNECKTRPDP